MGMQPNHRFIQEGFDIFEVPIRKIEKSKRVIEKSMVKKVSTLTNKADNFKISFLRIEMKNELENIREHARNIL